MRRELLKIPALILLFISFSLLLSFTSSVDLSKTGLGGFIGISIPESKSQEVPEKAIPFDYEKANMRKINEMSDPPMIPLFFVEGLNKYTNHLRLFTATEYRDGEWIEDEGDYNDRQMISGRKITKYSVVPLVPFLTHIPVAKDTFFVTAKTRFNAETGTYLVDNLSSRYDAFSSSHYIEGKKADGHSEEINVAGMEEIKRLTLEITRNAKNDFEKAKLIEKYLAENYKYDTEPWTSPNPVYTFLFEKKRGICKHFASAFVVMCRSIDLPARAVFGYLAKPVSHNQTVFASQAHVWAEVKFEEGWIEFDPTPPPGDKIPTATEITYVDSVVRKGGNFTIEGFVNTTGTVPEGYVEIYLKKDKNEDGNLVDILSVNNGFFHGNVTVPDISGEYHVVAHYVGSMRYESSWSDPIIKIYNPPGINANIPDRAARRCVIDGGVHDYNGTAIKNADVILKVDGKTYMVNTGEAGFFKFGIEFDRDGVYTVELYYPGDNFTLPASVKKQVEVGEVKLNIENTSAVRGEVWNTRGELFFKGEPLDSLIIFEDITNAMSRDGKFVINSLIPEDFPLGNVPVNFTISELKYTSQITLNIKSRTYLDVNLKKDKNWIVLVSITDDRGDPVSGEVIIANNTVFARNGIAKLEVEELPEKFLVEFPGNEKYLSSSRFVDRSGFPFWILALLIPVLAYLGYRMKKENYITFEWGDLPPVWDVCEEVSISIKNRGKGILRASLDNRGIEVGGALNLKFIFREPGRHILRAERLVNGKVKETKEIEIKIMNYRDAVVETFGELVRIAEEKKGINLRDATAREVMKKIKAANSKELIHLFEAAKYGYGKLTRKDFSRAYRSFLDIVEEIE